MVLDSVGTPFSIQIGVATSRKIGFFGAAPVARPAAPITLSDVINALTSLGLVAP